MNKNSTLKTLETKPNDQTHWDTIRAMPDSEIMHNADSPRTVISDWDNAVLKKAGVEIGRGRGPQKAELKTQMTLRFDQDILAAFKATGRGWQTRLNDLLRKHLDEVHS